MRKAKDRVVIGSPRRNLILVLVALTYPAYMWIRYGFAGILQGGIYSAAKPLALALVLAGICSMLRVVDASGIRFTVLGIPYRTLLWSQVQEYILVKEHDQIYHIFRLSGAPDYPHVPVEHRDFLPARKYIRMAKKTCVSVYETGKFAAAIERYFRKPDYVAKSKYAK